MAACPRLRIWRRPLRHERRLHRDLRHLRDNTAHDGTAPAPTPLDGTDVYILANGNGGGVNDNSSPTTVGLVDDILFNATASPQATSSPTTSIRKWPVQVGQDDLISENAPSTSLYPNSVGFTASTVLTGNPLLGPLASNGGPTQTMASAPAAPPSARGWPSTTSRSTSAASHVKRSPGSAPSISRWPLPRTLCQ